MLEQQLVEGKVSGLNPLGHVLWQESVVFSFSLFSKWSLVLSLAVDGQKKLIEIDLHVCR